MLIFFARQRLTAIPALDYSSTTCSHSASPVSAWSFSPHARHHNFILFIWHYPSPDCISLSRSQYTINGILFSAIMLAICFCLQWILFLTIMFQRNLILAEIQRLWSGVLTIMESRKSYETKTINQKQCSYSLKLPSYPSFIARLICKRLTDGFLHPQILLQQYQTSAI